MREFLKEYDIVLTTTGPVFIGSGKEIGKKEYVTISKGRIGVTDIERLYNKLAKIGKARQFEEFLLKNRRDDLTSWLRNENIDKKILEDCLKYELDCREAVIDRGTRPQLMEFVKDAYGVPYIPGSSLKGMLRTILLCSDIIDSPQKYMSQKSDIQMGVNSRNDLKKNATSVEQVTFRTMHRENVKREGDAVNDWMQGFRVSDSQPLSKESLVLCQKVELHSDGNEKRLPMLLECIKPDVKIRFTLTVDTEICKLDDKKIMKAVEIFADNYYNNFACGFKDTDRPEADSVLLGGGAGFISKTIIYPMYGKKKGLEVTRNLLMNRTPKIHKHDMDSKYGVSPHILKCTRLDGKLMKVGLCKISILPRGL